MEEAQLKEKLERDIDHTMDRHIEENMRNLGK